MEIKSILVVLVRKVGGRKDLNNKGNIARSTSKPGVHRFYDLKFKPLDVNLDNNNRSVGSNGGQKLSGRQD